MALRNPHELTDPALTPLLTWIDSYVSWEKLSERVRSDLARRAHLGDEGAIEAMTNHNLRLVLSRACKKMGRGVPLADLIQEGWLGLRLAVERYDPGRIRRGSQFSSMAVWWIDRALRDCIIKQGRTIYLPHNASERFARIYARVMANEPLRSSDQVWLDRLGQQLTSNPNLTGVTLDYVDHLLKGTISIDRPLTNEHIHESDAGALADILPAPTQGDLSDTIDLEHLLLDLVNTGILTRRDGWLIIRHYGLDGEGGRGYSEMARELYAAEQRAGIVRPPRLDKPLSRQRIEQLISTAMRKVRQYVNATTWQSATKGVYSGEQTKRPASAPITGQSDSTASPKRSARRTSDDSSKTTASPSAAPVPTPLRAHDSTKRTKGSSGSTRKSSGLDVPYAEAI